MSSLCEPEGSEPRMKKLHIQDEETEILKDHPRNIGTLNPPRDCQWAQLPSPAIQNIYSHLGRNDRCQMSLVCTSWSKEFGSPSLWDTIEYCITNQRKDMAICPDVKFARKYGHMFRNVTIRWINICEPENIIKAQSRQLELFLTTLTAIAVSWNNSEIRHFKFTGSGFLRCLKTTERSNLFHILIQFLKCQKKLKNVVFGYGNLSYEEMAEILAVIAANSAKSIRKLSLKDCVVIEVVSAPLDEKLTKSLSCMFTEKFPNLTVLNIYYSCIFEKILLSESNIAEAFKSIKNTSLSKIKLNCHGNNRMYFEGIPSTVWRRLKHACPLLMVDLILTTDYDPHQDVQFYVVPDMPIRKLHFHGWFHGCEMNNVVNHLLRIKCNLQLEKITLPFLVTPDVAQLLFFLQSCPVLRSFVFQVDLPVDEVEHMLQSWMDVRPESLESVHLVMTKLDCLDYSNLTVIFARYVPLLQNVGLKLSYDITMEMEED